MEVAFYLLQKPVRDVAVLGQHAGQRRVSVFKLRVVGIVRLEESHFLLLQIGGLYSCQYTKFLPRKVISFFKTSRRLRLRLWLWKSREMASLDLGFKWQYYAVPRNRDIMRELRRSRHWTSDKNRRLPLQAVPGAAAHPRHWGLHLAKIFTTRRARRLAGFSAAFGARR